MAGGGFGNEGGNLKTAHLYEYKITNYFIFACLVVATGGSLFGYDLGVSGGVTFMDDFLKEFFPKIYRRKQAHLHETDYCKYDNSSHFLRLCSTSQALFLHLEPPMLLETKGVEPTSLVQSASS